MVLNTYFLNTVSSGTNSTYVPLGSLDFSTFLLSTRDDADSIKSEIFEFNWKDFFVNNSDELKHETKKYYFRNMLTEKDPIKLELLQIDIDEKTYSVANMQLVARDRMREIKLWSTLKKEFNDGSFDTKDVNKHQLDSYAIIMKNKAETLTSGSSQPEVFNVLGQLQSIERVKKSGEMIYNKKDKLTHDLGAKSE